MIDRMRLSLCSYIALRARDSVYARNRPPRCRTYLSLFTFILTVNMKYMALQDDRYSGCFSPLVIDGTKRIN